MDENKIEQRVAESISESTETGRFAGVKKRVQKVSGYLKDGMWTEEALDGGWAKRFGVKFLRFLQVVLRGFSEHRLGLHAGGLTLASLLSIVPILMLMLLLTKPCGMYAWAREKLRVQTDNMIETFFEQKGIEKNKLEELALSMAKKPANQEQSAKEFGKQARDLRDQVLGEIDKKIENFNFGLMAIVGFLILAWTVTSTFGQAESSMNEIWHVKKARPVYKRILLYAGTLMVAPFLVALAMSLPILRGVKSALDATLGATSYTKWVGDAIINLLDSTAFSWSVMMVFATLAVGFVFWVMPNRKVQFRAALEGGFITALILVLWMRLCALAQSLIFGSSAAYGSFALVPILIVWVRFNWLFILLGSNVTYAFQCLHHRVRDLPDVDE